MQFNDTTNDSGICQETDSLCDSDSTSYPLKDKTRRANTALEQIVGWILEADGTWQFDDTNYTDFPVGTYTLVDGQAKYSFNDQFLEIENVQIMTKEGKYQIIKPIDQYEYSKVTPLEEAFETDGLPQYYDKMSDDTIKLYPAPDDGSSVTLASGLKIKFRRTAHLFKANGTDASAVPGFASPYHIIVAYMTARPYCMTYKKDRVAMIDRFVGDTTDKPTGMKKAILKHYSRREQDKRKIMRNKPINYI